MAHQDGWHTTEIELQKHTKDACDACVAYWKAKRSFLQSLSSGLSLDQKATFLEVQIHIASIDR